MSEFDQLYREVILDHYKNPRGHGLLENADAEAEANEENEQRKLTHGKVDGGRVSGLPRSRWNCRVNADPAYPVRDLHQAGGSLPWLRRRPSAPHASTDQPRWALQPARTRPGYASPSARAQHVLSRSMRCLRAAASTGTSPVCAGTGQVEVKWTSNAEVKWRSNEDCVALSIREQRGRSSGGQVDIN